jgi:multiple sugar transport system substrate-binding protein
MIKSKFVFALLVVLLIVAVVPVSAQESVNVLFWSPFTGPDGVVIEEMVNEFNQTAGAEAGVTVELLIVPWEEYYTKLTVSIASGQGPNLAIAHSHRVPGFAQEGVLLEYSNDALAALDINPDDYIPALWNAGEYEGARYALPIDAFPRNLFINDRVFENAGLDPATPPTNLEELISAAEAIKAYDANITPIFFSTTGSWAARDFYSVYYQNAPSLLSEDGTSVAPEFHDAATAALQTWMSLIEQGYASATPGDWAALFAQDQVGIAFAQITHLLSLSQIEGLAFSAAEFPVLGTQPGNFTLGHNFILPAGASQDDAHIRGALTFINWFNQNAFDWAAGGKVPASLTVINSEAFATLEAQAIAAGQMDAMRLPPIIPEQSDIDAVVQENVEAVYGGQSSIEDAVNRMAEEINDLLG